MMRIGFGLLLLTTLAMPAVAQDATVRLDPPPPAPAQDKSGYWLFNPTPTAALRGFNTDRPTKSNSPITVDAGHVQYETDIFNYTHSNVGGFSTRIYQAFDPVLKIGLTNNVDFEVQINGYNWIDVDQPNGARIARFRGASDILLRPKINVFGNEGGPALAIIPYVKFPTAARNIGNGHTEGGVILPISYPLPFGFTALLVPEVDVLKNANDAGHHFNFTQLINISHPIGSQVTVYGELFSALGTDSRIPPIYTLDAAVSYAVTDNLQLDIGTNVGLNRAAPNLQLYTGIAQRF